jgi:chromosome segregation ATPase
VQEEKAKIEQKLISAAQKDLQRDQSASTDQELRELQVKYDHIETQFAQTNVKLGDVLNQYNELEEQYSHVVNVNQQLGQENLDLRQALNLKSPSGRKK